MAGAADIWLPSALLRLALALVVFVLPGFLWADFLTRKSLPWPARVALGFAVSFAVFGMLGWPFLWWRRPFADFLQFLYPAWGLFALSSALHLPATIGEARRQTPLPHDSGGGRRQSRRVKAELAAASVGRRPLIAYVVGVLSFIYVYAYVSSLRSILLRLAPLLDRKSVV